MSGAEVGSPPAAALPPGPWVEGGLDDALARLDRALAARAAGEALSFDAGDPEAERELMHALSVLGPETVSFAAEAEERERAEESGSRVTRFLDELLVRAGATARVETRVEGRLVASTTVTLGGSSESALDAAASPADLDLHARSLGEALRTRRAWMRVLLATLQATAKIAAATGTGNALLVLPAAWKFIRTVMAEWQEQKQQAA